MLEQALTERIGMPTRIEGEFDLMLLPDIGASGTGLVMGGQESGSVFASSSEFEVSVALKPLFDRRVQVEWIRLTGGRVDPAYYARAGTDDPPGGMNLPDVRELAIREFQLILSQEDEHSLQVREFTVRNFSQNSPAPFSLEIEGLVKVSGSLLWDTARSRVHLQRLELDLQGQKLSADGCLVTVAPVSLNATAQAGVFDADAFRESLPRFGDKEGGSGGMPLEINARLSVDELRAKGAVARGVSLSVGRDPSAVCATD